MDELNYALNTTKTFETRAYAKLKFDLTSWLNYNVMFQYETSDSDYESLGEKESNFMRKRINDFTSNHRMAVLWYIICRMEIRFIR